MNHKKDCLTCLSRRDVLKLAGLAAGSAALCGLGLPPFASAAAPGGETGAVQFREIPKSGLKLSTVGIGAGNLKKVANDEIQRVVALALEHGINYIDLLIPDAEIAAVAKALGNRRSQIVTQVHIGAVYRDGQYNRTRNMRLVREGMERNLAQLGGYTDIALLHYVDKTDDYERIMQDGMFEYARDLQKQGKVRSLGFSTHSTDIARQFMKTGAFDMYMLSINPAYDFAVSGGKLTQSADRASLYQETARNGMGIVCMKTYNGGRLLNASTSPFGRAMTPNQCIQYCLDRPAVVSCPVGINNVKDMQAAIGYYSSSREDRSYAFLGALQNQDVAGSCVYCNHCLPCPAGIDIGLAMKYYDLARAGDEHARDHYHRMPKTAADCIYCDACEKNCPFGIGIQDIMREMTAYFAKA